MAEITIEISDGAYEALQGLAEICEMEPEYLASKMLGKTIINFEDTELVRNVPTERKSIIAKLQNIDFLVVQAIATRHLVTQAYADLVDSEERVMAVNNLAEEKANELLNSED
jgi:hypothetical protein